jgi:starch synthase (maltosyl-transferring)
MASKRTAEADDSGWRALVVGRSAGEQTPAAQANLARSLGFDSLLAFFATPDDPAAARPEIQDALAALIDAAHEAGLRAQIGLVLDRQRSHHAVAPDAFRAETDISHTALDPRRPLGLSDGVRRLCRPHDPALLGWWCHALRRLRGLGVDGFVQLDADRAGRALATTLGREGFRIRDLRTSNPDLETDDGFLIDAGGVDGAGLRDRLARAIFAGGWAISGLDDTAPDGPISQANHLQAALHGRFGGKLRDWTGPRASLSVLSRQTRLGALVLVQNRGRVPLAWPRSAPGLPWQDLEPVPGFEPAADGLASGAAALFAARERQPVRAAVLPSVDVAAAPALRVIIGGFSPAVDQGAFAAKAVIGDRVEITADIFTDGHEQLAASVLVRAEDETDWRRHPLRAEPNDVWTGTVRFARLGRHEIRLEAWLDVWGGFVRDFAKKRDAGKDLALDVREGRSFLDKAQERAQGEAAQVIADALAALDATPGAGAILLSADLSAAMAAADDRPFLVQSFVQPIEVEREAARFSSWYELFPRSQTDDRHRHGTFADVARRLPHIAAMGFDTLYFPPIHPIGAANRKGRNNSLTAEPGDVGSPYAIGAPEGGHAAIHPDLGSLEDFRALVAAAALHGIEIALDFAIQCSPDHPWLKQHPGWFDWRPDGSLKYAENPPKTYEDIVNVDFYARDSVPALWEALRDAVLFWVAQGVKVFRVDNPHTKPLPFWQWLIAQVKGRHPDVIFLSEAFTRPKRMYHLAKIGFSQSYTYFTWRHTKAEFQDYIIELTKTPVRDFFRPHFFVNTPDINPYFLQSSGRAGFLIRAALAATLSGLFGVYAGFELCESAAPSGREDYLDSEKYEIRPRPDRAPGDIVDELTALNHLRRQEPALQSHIGVDFHDAFNDQILYFSKTAPGRADRILVAINLDPHAAQEADFEVPLWLCGLADWDGIEVEDLLAGTRFRWTGKIQHVRLGPERPYALWRIGGEA